MRLKPLGGKAIVFVPKEQERVTPDGIVVVEDKHREDTYREATILAVSDGTIHSKTGERIPPTIAVGDKVLIYRFSGLSIQPEYVGFDRELEPGEEIRLIMEDDIIIVHE